MIHRKRAGFLEPDYVSPQDSVNIPHMLRTRHDSGLGVMICVHKNKWLELWRVTDDKNKFSTGEAVRYIIVEYNV